MFRKYECRFLILFISVLFFSCHEKRDSYNFEKSKYNILNIQKTNYTYKDNFIYEYDNYNVDNNDFPATNYFIIENNKFFSIFNFKQLNESDINGFDHLFHFENGRKFENAADYKYLVVDFDLKIIDSLKKKPGSLILKEKFYDKVINDTVYIFSRKFKKNVSITNVVASKKYGIMGMYDFYIMDKNKKDVFNNYGFTYLNRLDSTYFYKNSEKPLNIVPKKPYLDLSKIKFLSRAR